MDWNVELTIALRALVAALLGALIGLDRHRHGYEAGIRTFAAVALGASAFAAISVHLPSIVVGTGASSVDPSRIAANVVGAVGFLGAGVLLRDRGGRTRGLTTAATIWATASVGLAAGFGMFVLATLLALMTAAILFSHHFYSGNEGNSEEGKNPGKPANPSKTVPDA